MRARPSHICSGADKAAERWRNTASRFSPACRRPVKNKAMGWSGARAMMPVVKMPVRAGLVSAWIWRRRAPTRMVVSSLKTWGAWAASQANWSYAGCATRATASASSHWVEAAKGTPRLRWSCSNR